MGRQWCLLLRGMLAAAGPLVAYDGILNSRYATRLLPDAVTCGAGCWITAVNDGSIGSEGPAGEVGQTTKASRVARAIQWLRLLILHRTLVNKGFLNRRFKRVFGDFFRGKKVTGGVRGQRPRAIVKQALSPAAPKGRQRSV